MALQQAAVSHKNAVAVACGKNAKAKGTIGSYIVLTEWNNDANELLTAKLYRVDGEKVKADTWYILRNGELEEVDDGEEQQPRPVHPDEETP